MGGAVEFYKWPGTQFVRYKCVETEIDNKGKYHAVRAVGDNEL